jgi:hypothetical protein
MDKVRESYIGTMSEATSHTPLANYEYPKLRIKFIIQKLYEQEGRKTKVEADLSPGTSVEYIISRCLFETKPSKGTPEAQGVQKVIKLEVSPIEFHDLFCLLFPAIDNIHRNYQQLIGIFFSIPEWAHKFIQWD